MTHAKEYDPYNHIEFLKIVVKMYEEELAAIKSAPIAGWAHEKTCHYRKHKPDDTTGWIPLIRKPE